MRTLRLVVAVLLVSGTLTMARPAPTHASSAATAVGNVTIDGPTGSEANARTYIDHELLASLEAAGLSDTWYTSSPHGIEASGLRVAAGIEYDVQRGVVMHLADQIAASRAVRTELVTAIAEFGRGIGLLESLARYLRERVVADRDDLSGEELALIHKALAKATSTGHEDLGHAVEAVERLRLYIGAELAIAQRGDVADKSTDAGPVSAVLAELDALRTEVEELRIRAQEATIQEARLVESIELIIAGLHEQRGLARTEIDRLPLVTLDAYIRAGNHHDLECAVDWNLLAGIGRAESFHGTLDDSTVSSTGQVQPAILGPILDGGASQSEHEAAMRAAERLVAAAVKEAERLAEEEEQRERVLFGDWYPPADEESEEDPPDGEVDEAEEAMRLLYGDYYAREQDDNPSDDEESSNADADDDDEDTGHRGNGFAVIADTDLGVLDGDEAWDRAVGPMQFLPETWANWQRDGNDDGIIDPHNLYDAAASAAAYLCHLERRLGPAPRRYVLGYNDSTEYVAKVLGVAERLGRYDVASDRG